MTISPCKLIDYVWIGGNNELRSKTRVIYNEICCLDDIPVWNYDGSSTLQATGSSSEVYLYPKCFFFCPFRRNGYAGYSGYSGYIVMCDTYDVNGEPLATNHRYSSAKIFEKYSSQKPWFGLEQEYFIYCSTTSEPIGFDSHNKQGQYYCSVGGKNAYGRQIADDHLEACLYAGIQISGINAEVAPGQWEFQIGPTEGIAASDQLWIARYILEKISENYSCYIVYHPKPLKGDWNGSGCHTNFSTESMRAKNGYDVIIDAIKKLELVHLDHMKIYGLDNEQRMSGKHETSSYDKFSYGVANRNASIRIPTDTANNKSGYFEDRRPAANIDPYQVTAKILETIMS